jgi:PII-like signaling protein
MKSIDVVVIRVYLPADGTGRDALLRRLRDWQHVRGVTLVEGVRGFGPSGEVDGPSLLEIVDEPAKAAEVIEFLDDVVPAGHVVYWPAQMRVAD